MITLLKLGGSLITDKDRPHTLREDVLNAAAREIAEAWLPNPFPLIIGHGSGSFGHVPGKKYQTRLGVYSPEAWKGFAEVHAEAVALNHHVINALRGAGLPAVGIVPMTCVTSSGIRVKHWDLNALRTFMEQGLLPVVFGDTVLDDQLGGTILSTEDLFVHLCAELSGEKRVLLAGLEAGVWSDYPRNTCLVPTITATQQGGEFVQESASVDVTGGMKEKVRLMQSLIQSAQAEEARIFSGLCGGNIRGALQGEPVGTLIRK